MRLAEDRRARVPFALVGIVLLLGSATYVATLSQRGPPDSRPDVVEAREQVTSAVDTAVRRATVRAAARAASEPVVEAADTAAGGALDDQDPFRDYLELRVYLAVRRSLESLSVTTGTATATASLPRPDGPADAIERVGVARGDENASLDIHVENVTIRVRRGSGTVLTRTISIDRTVASPVLALHDRVRSYQEKLNATLETSGLAARVAALLYSTTWSRSYMQWAGVPITNVLANRHLAVLTNYALLAIQRDVFGRNDPLGTAALKKAAGTMLLQDAGSVARTGAEEYLDAVWESRRNVPSPVALSSNLLPEVSGAPSPSTEMRMDVDATADRALVRFLTNDSGRSLTNTLEMAYSAQVRYRTAKRVVVDEPRPEPDRPGPDWKLAGTRTSKSVAVVNDSGPRPAIPDDWHRFTSFTRRVEVTHRVVRTWAHDNETRIENETWSSVVAVGVAVDGRHAPTGWIPRRGIRTVHERGAGPLDDPNLAGMRLKAIKEFLGNTTRAELARRAKRGTLSEDAVSLRGDRPAGLRALARAEVLELRRRIGNASTAVSRGKVGTGEANPAKRLQAELEARRAQLVDAPATYESVAEKARVAARAAYLDAVIARLDHRATLTRKRNDGVGKVLKEFNLSQRTVRRAMRADPPSPHSEGPLFADGIAGPVNVTVAGAPAYLARAAVTREQVRAVRPGTEFHALRTKNVNVFTAPYGDAADVVLDQFTQNTSTTSLRTAAATLRAANRTLAKRDNRTLERRRDELGEDVVMAVLQTRERLLSVHEDLRSDPRIVNVDPNEWITGVKRAYRGWGSRADTAMAVVNGSIAREIATLTARRENLNDSQRDLVALHVRMALDRALEDTEIRPEQEPVNGTARTAKEVAKPLVAEVGRAAFNKSFETLQRKYAGKYKLVPAGLPVTPIPAYYYAVLNLWITDVRGAYASFTVSTSTGAPVDSPTVRYRRDGDAVRLDVDGDGERELLGWARRISFKVVVPIVVVVPPKPTGFGDRNGNADERSDGWPESPPLINGSRPGRGTGVVRTGHKK